MIRINFTLYEFLRENIRTGISNMEDIHEMMLWKLSFMLGVHMTTVMIQITSFSSLERVPNLMRSEKNWLIITWKYTPNLDEVIIQAPASWDFGLEVKILQIGWFYRPKWKIFEKSASKNKHPIKLRFSNWSLQSANPEKKVIPEKHEFGSYPLTRVFFPCILSTKRESHKTCSYGLLFNGLLRQLLYFSSFFELQTFWMHLAKTLKIANIS